MTTLFDVFSVTHAFACGCIVRTTSIVSTVPLWFAREAREPCIVTPFTTLASPFSLPHSYFARPIALYLVLNFICAVGEQMLVVVRCFLSTVD